MKINTNSWHCRLLKKTGCDRMPKDLCGYFWALVGRGVIGLVLLVALVFIAIIVIATRGIALLTAIGILGIIFGFATFFIKLSEGNSVFFSWLRARKQKICPLIEYVDKKK